MRIKARRKLAVATLALATAALMACGMMSSAFAAEAGLDGIAAAGGADSAVELGEDESGIQLCSVIKSGRCGENDCLSWSLDSNGTLTISGNGKMINRRMINGPVPLWGKGGYYPETNTQVKRIVIGEGVTYVGDNEFRDCQYVERVDLPSTLTSVGNCAFAFNGQNRPTIRVKTQRVHNLLTGSDSNSYLQSKYYALQTCYYDYSWGKNLQPYVAYMPGYAPSDHYFDDVTNPEEWYTSYVDTAAKLNLVSGYSGTRLYGPNDSLSRGMVVTLLYRAYTGKTAASTDNRVYCQFDDVPSGEWYTAAVQWAYSKGIATGYTGTNSFGPDDPVNREQLATFIARYAAYVKSGGTTTDITKVESYSFATTESDWNEVSDYAYKTLGWCKSQQIITGYTGAKRIAPQDGATRAQMAKVIVVTVHDVLKQR